VKGPHLSAPIVLAVTVKQITPAKPQDERTIPGGHRGVLPPPIAALMVGLGISHEHLLARHLSAATTQFHADQSLDVQATILNVEKLLAAGMHGRSCSVRRRNTTLDYNEKLEVLKATIEQVRKRIPV